MLNGQDNGRLNRRKTLRPARIVPRHSLAHQPTHGKRGRRLQLPVASPVQNLGAEVRHYSAIGVSLHLAWLQAAVLLASFKS
jgi:hypothetical protein